jgi:glycosyltransferase involved in cell wall biosynthesis
MFNESSILPLVIKHWKKFVDNIIFYDNGSTDSSKLIAESMGCQVIHFETGGKLDDIAYLNIKNNAWKNSEADYCIVCDCDEILFFLPYPERKLFEENLENGTTIFKTHGWNIYSNEIPKDDLLEITTGYTFDNYSKFIMFSPQKIAEMNYQPGAHKCSPYGEIKYSDEVLYLLHYKNIGGVERLLNRNRLFSKRMSVNNMKNGFGSHYNEAEGKTRKVFAERLAKSKSLL